MVFNIKTRIHVICICNVCKYVLLTDSVDDGYSSLVYVALVSGLSLGVSSITIVKTNDRIYPRIDLFVMFTLSISVYLCVNWIDFCHTEIHSCIFTLIILCISLGQ